MKPLFKNITKYSKENYNNLLEFHKNKFGIKIIISTLIMMIICIYMLILNIIYKNWEMILIILLFMIILIVIKNLLQSRKKEIKENNKMIERNQNYIYNFYKYYFRVKIGRKGERIFYFKLHKVYETKDSFYLYTDKDHSLIVSKEGFTIGNSRGFSNFIKKKCVLKYKDERK